VNTAARLQGVAGPGEIAMTDAVYASVRSSFPEAEARLVSLRGKKEQVPLHVVTVGSG
jgi:class 3 adenylate cyclase